MRHDFPLHQLYWLFPMNSVSMCSLILFVLVSANLTNLPGAAIRPVDPECGISSSELWLMLMLYFPPVPPARRLLPTELSTTRHVARSLAPCHCCPREDQLRECALWDPETSCLSWSACSSTSSLDYREGSEYLHDPYAGFCHCIRQKKLHLQRYEQMERLCVF